MGDSFIIAVLVGYLFIGASLMLALRGLRGIMATIIIGWLFLPPARGINLPGLPMYTKEFAVSYALLIGVMLTDSGRLFAFRPKLIDLPMLLWILSPLPASVTNGLGYYDGLSEVYNLFFVYGVFYLIGRSYIKTPEDIRVVAKWFVLAGLIAIPFVLWESRMSPQLNRNIYGYSAAPFHAAKRLGGYRPMLFMRHGLEVGLWMATCSAVALWLWITSQKSERILGFKLKVPTLILLFATVMCRSFGALILLAGNIATAMFVRTTGLRIALIALVLTPGVYLSVRLSNIWSPDQLTSIIEAINPERAVSLEARLNQELRISRYALQKPIFGWGAHDRYRPINEEGEREPVDGWTSITLGKTGLFGLVSLVCVTTLPSLILLLRVKGRDITSSIWAPSIGILLGISIFSLDILFNAFPTPLHFMGIGVLASAAVYAKQWQRVMYAHQKQTYLARQRQIHEHQNEDQESLHTTSIAQPTRSRPDTSRHAG